MTIRGLTDVRVIDFTSGIAGPYATKLLADAGAEVIKIEDADGDPMRAWSASGSVPPDEDSALFQFLNTSKRSVVGASDDVEVEALVASADVVVEGGDLDVEALRRAHEHLVVVSVTPFGRTGPMADHPWTEFTVQAESGSTLSRGAPGWPAFQAGGRISEWTTGSYAAPAMVAGVIAARRNGVGAHIDCSMLEVMAIAGSTFSDVMHSILGRYPLDGTVARGYETPSIEPASDGWVGFNTNTGAMFQSFLLMIERPDLLEDAELAGLAGRTRRIDEWSAIVRAWTSQHTVADILERAAELRIPATEVYSGETVLGNEQLVNREAFIANPDGFLQPRPPYLVNGSAARRLVPAPTLGEGNGRIAAGPFVPLSPVPDDALPFAGVRILDFTSWWAGPSATSVFAMLGAEVVHVESTGHPDGMRMTGFHFGHADWWEWGHMFLPVNVDKLGLTLDVGTPRGKELALELIGRCDAVVENFAPRVFEQWGLTWDVVHERNPRAVMMRMPAFGLTGPWRDRVGFAQTMEQMSGMAWVTGFVEDQPRIVRGPCDPIAGMHGALALMVGLEEARRSGEGVFIESTMVEAALNCAAEQVVEFTAYEQVLERDGNRSPYAAPQGLYACAGDERWLALSVVTDEHWRGLAAALGRPAWATEPALERFDGRRAAADALDAHLGDWAATQDVERATALLLEHGVPAATAWDPRVQSRHPQLVARGLYEECEHPVVGTHPVPGLPYRWSGIDRWVRTPAPTLGEHSRDVLRGWLGVSDTELDELESSEVIGTRPRGL
jgi:crotonobetainyl-CoA:carnitine CoA-transferase CaiB-like acyl-CoA transferase